MSTNPLSVRRQATVTRTGHVLLVGINYAPETTGIAPYSQAMAESLVASGMRVTTVTGVPHYPNWEVTDPRYRHGSRWEERLNGVDVVRVAHHVPGQPGLSGRSRMESSFLRAARREVARLDSSAIIAVTPSLAAAGAALMSHRNRPVGIVVQDLTGAGATQSGTTNGPVGETIRHVEFSLLRRADLIGVITPRFAEILAAHGVAPDRIVEVSNFSHVDRIDVPRREARLRLGWDFPGSLVVHTGNMGMKQGLEHVISTARVAHARGADVSFVLVGAGNRRDDLVALARGLPNVHIMEPVSQADYPYVLAAADLLLLHERPGVVGMSMPSKLTSYVCAGRPIVAAVEADGITGSVLRRAGAAEIVVPGDPEGLLTAILRVSSDHERCRDLVSAAAAMREHSYRRDAAEKRYQAFAARLLEVGRRT